MIYIAMVVVMVFGLIYAMRPELFLRRKYGNNPPPIVFRTARATGIIMVLVGGAWLFLLLGQGA